MQRVMRFPGWFVSSCLHVQASTCPGLVSVPGSGSAQVQVAPSRHFCCHPKLLPSITPLGHSLEWIKELGLAFPSEDNRAITLVDFN